MENMGKARVTAFVEKDVKKELEDGKQNRSLSNHVADILTQHVEKNKPKPFVSKQEVKPNGKKEYDSTPQHVKDAEQTEAQEWFNQNDI